MSIVVVVLIVIVGTTICIGICIGFDFLCFIQRSLLQCLPNLCITAFRIMTPNLSSCGSNKRSGHTSPSFVRIRKLRLINLLNNRYDRTNLTIKLPPCIKVDTKRRNSSLCGIPVIRRSPLIIIEDNNTNSSIINALCHLITKRDYAALHKTYHTRHFLITTRTCYTTIDKLTFHIRNFRTMKGMSRVVLLSIKHSRKCHIRR
mmetsp:Transcript_12748/g.18584  ORF Transcript_12748/g.18584 Transcript_12748/m.18584 type:complete len:203 (-) Transcript_12748:995-1603(-)